MEYNRKIEEIIDDLIQLKDKAYRIAFYLTGNHHDAEDLVQESYVRIVVAIKKTKFDLTKPVDAYFFKIIRNIYFDYIKKRKKLHFISLTNDEDNNEFRIELCGSYEK